MRKTSAVLSGFAIACLVMGIWSRSSVVATTAAQEKPAKSDAATAKTVHAEMHNVMYHFSDKIVGTYSHIVW